MSKFKVILVCGSEAVDRIAEGVKLTKEDQVYSYEFDSEAERAAFIRGVHAAVGWNETYIPDADEFRKLKGKAEVQEGTSNEDMTGDYYAKK